MMWLAIALVTIPASLLREDATQAADRVVPTYEWLHAHPELSGQEAATAARFADELRQVTNEVHEHVGGHGVVAILRNGKAPHGPVVIYRADMDALPVNEATGLKHASTVPGVMHACGHDLHMATAIAVGHALRANETAWRGTVVIVGQPSEEMGDGARGMLRDPQWQRIVASLGQPVRVALAWHDDAGVAAGNVGLRSGPITASVDAVDIVVHGKGGHGARPEQTVDATVIGAEVVGALQTIVSRTVAPQQQAVVTVGQFVSGTKRNIIAQTATLNLTVRTYEPAVRRKVLQGINDIATHIAAAHGATVEISGTSETPVPSVINDPTWTEHLRAALRESLGADHVVMAEQSMGGEDFSEFGERWPLVLMRLGAVDPSVLAHSDASALPSLHSDSWAPEARQALRTGVHGMLVAIGAVTRSDS